MYSFFFFLFCILLQYKNNLIIQNKRMPPIITNKATAASLIFATTYPRSCGSFLNDSRPCSGGKASISICRSKGIGFFCLRSFFISPVIIPEDVSAVAALDIFILSEGFNADFKFCMAEGAFNWLGFI